MKKIFFFGSYYRQKIFKNIRQVWKVLLFIVPGLIYVLILFPTLFNKYPLFFGIPKTLPNVFTINGEILSKNKKIKECSLEVGGFKTKSDDTRHFSFSFVSIEVSQIPLIITCNKKEEIFRLDYNGSSEINQKFIIK